MTLGTASFYPGGLPGQPAGIGTAEWFAWRKLQGYDGRTRARSATWEGEYLFGCGWSEWTGCGVCRSGRVTFVAGGVWRV